MDGEGAPSRAARTGVPPHSPRRFRPGAVRFLLRDRDGTFSAAFDIVLTGADIQVLLTPPRPPKANTFTERWVRAVRRDCTDSPREHEEDQDRPATWPATELCTVELSRDRRSAAVGARCRHQVAMAWSRALRASIASCVEGTMSSPPSVTLFWANST